MSDTKDIITTIVAEESRKNPGEAIGNYGRSLVFMPQGCKAGATYRVRLQFTGKNDKANRPLYRGTPDACLESDRWIDNGDETARRVTVYTSWDMREVTSETLEIRPLSSRDGDSRQTITTHVVLGASIQDTVVTKTTKTLIDVLKMSVEKGALIESKISDRDGGSVAENFTPTSIIPASSNRSWWDERFGVSYRDDLPIRLKVEYGGKDSESLEVPWGEIPSWLQKELRTPYPTCSCGRKRIDSQSGEKVCEICREDERQLTIVNEQLPAEKREEIATVAQGCYAASKNGGALKGGEGEMVLEHLIGSATTVEYRGYPWYYILENGVILGSCFSPEAMMILALLPQAKGTGLLQMAAWLPTDAQGHRTEGVGSGFYHRTQVLGEAVDVRLSSWQMGGACVGVTLKEAPKKKEAKQKDPPAPIQPRYNGYIPPGTETTFVEKSTRQFKCGNCGRIETLEQVQWNLLRNTGKARMSCSCGCEGEVTRTVPVTTTAQSSKKQSPTSGVDVRSLLQKFGR